MLTILSREILEKFFFSCFSEQCCSKNSFSAEQLPDCSLATGISFRFASCEAVIAILWDTVLVNRIIKSGQPSFFRSGPFS